MQLHKFNRKAEQQAQERAQKKASPWKLGGLGPVELGRRVYRQVEEDEILTRSAALSYYFIFALFPMLFFLVAVMGLFARSHDVQSGLFSYSGRFMPPETFSLLRKTLREIASASTGLKLVFGLMLAMWSASGGVSSIMDALNRCYRVKDSRPYVKQRLISLALTIGISALVITAMVMTLYGGDIARFVGARTGLSDLAVLLWQLSGWAVSFLFVVISFALLYYWGPDVEQQWRWITPGSLFGVLAWLAASFLLRAYLHYFNNFSKTYGSLGAVILLLVWLYIAAMAILLGGEINSEIENAAAEHGHPEAKPEGRKVA